ncbi:SapC family protein [Pseudoxanthomonas suwonensis 11-1]|uniref:SapC family protein n=1 Tax=Pseudoxanthomonas suwonensis (strain 11-1) TaxID=743721 RepID=E6WQL5_PSEUU|nr:SapC family protein [Pseudoxanthomonas suwonensis]ADV26464.1 SapC family protein [Pseudoxanthomonas suwonensis 11-1]
MARYELLNNLSHGHLRVSSRFGDDYGDGVGMVEAFPTEFAEMQREYPIFLRKDPDGSWHAVALLGFGPSENLYVRDGAWHANYLPAVIARGPFLIGFQEQMVDGQLRNEPVIHVDLDHPRLRDGHGHPVFAPQGGNSPYLEKVLRVLRGIHAGVEGARRMYPDLDRLGLIQPVALDVKFDDAHQVNLTGLYSIDRDRLAALDSDQVYSLHTAGWLEGIYLLLSSLHNVPRLIAEKQRRLHEEAEGKAA